MQETTDRNRSLSLLSLLIIVLYGLLYFSTLRDLVSLWSSNEDYGHGFFVIPVSLYLIWRRRRDIVGGMDGPSRWGPVLLAAWAVFYGIGTIGHITTVTNLSMLVFPMAAAATLVSGTAARIIAWPVLFTAFMFPTPSEIYTRVTNPLLLMSTTVSFHILSAFGLPVLQEGNLITLPNYAMEVVQACSGIRSLVTIMALAYLMCFFMSAAGLLRVLFFVMAVPVAILGNILRITATALIAYMVSPSAAEGFSHTLAGLVTFSFSFVLLYACMELVQWHSRTREQQSSS